MLFATWKRIIREGDIRADESIILDSDSIPKLHARFDRDPVPNHDIVFYEDVIAQIAVRPDVRFREDVHEGPDLGSRANMFCFNDCSRMFVIWHSYSLFSLFSS